MSLLKAVDRSKHDVYEVFRQTNLLKAPKTPPHQQVAEIRLIASYKYITSSQCRAEHGNTSHSFIIT